MSQFYVGIDLHTRTLQVCVINREGEKVLETNLPTDLELVVDALRPFPPELTSIAIESTYNWYWLVDGLASKGYDVRLAHAYGLYLITGSKTKTDRKDAHRLARYLRLGELPEGYIYPREKRPVRDLLRRRMGLVRQRTSAYTGLRIQFRQHNVDVFNLQALKNLEEEHIDHLSIPAETATVCKMTLQRIQLLNQQVHLIEKQLQTRVRREPEFKLLKTLPGVDKILGLTIYYEVGDISRFPSDRNFASYCRLVPPVSISGGKQYKASGGKQGNPYLKWAFTQAAMAASRYYPNCRRFKERHANKRRGNLGKLIANNILAHKLATAAFFILRDNVPYNPTKLN